MRSSWSSGSTPPERRASSVGPPRSPPAGIRWSASGTGSRLISTSMDCAPTRSPSPPPAAGPSTSGAGSSSGSQAPDEAYVPVFRRVRRRLGRRYGRKVEGGTPTDAAGSSHCRELADSRAGLSHRPAYFSGGSKTRTGRRQGASSWNGCRSDRPKANSDSKG
jgi:hypothetical protein